MLRTCRPNGNGDWHGLVGGWGRGGGDGPPSARNGGGGPWGQVEEGEGYNCRM